MKRHAPFIAAAISLALAPSPQDEPKKAVRKPLPDPETIAALPEDGGPEFNRLVFEQSPYLLQHLSLIHI